MYFYNNPLISESNSNWSPGEAYKKIDIKHCQDILHHVIKHKDFIDSHISKFLKENWTIDKLDLLIKSILRSAVAEAMRSDKPDTPIVTSESTNLASKFLFQKQIGFVNGVLDKAVKSIRESQKYDS